jgi:hypothetical protein
MLLKRSIFAVIFVSLRYLSQHPENASWRGDENPYPNTEKLYERQYKQELSE